MAFSVSAGRQDGVATVTLVGELDLAGADTATEAISQEITTMGTREVRIDLSQTQFIDSSGIAILLKGRREADKTGVAYRVTGAAGMIRQILRLTGVLEHLCADTTADAPR